MRKRALWTTLSNGSLRVDRLRDETREHLVHTDEISTVNTGQNFVHELRAQYGEQIAFLFAYNRFHLRSLLFLTPIGLATLFVNDKRANLVFGIIVACIWSPLHLALWKRQQAEHAFQWHMNSKTFEEATRTRFQINYLCRRPRKLGKNHRLCNTALPPADCDAHPLRRHPGILCSMALHGRLAHHILHSSSHTDAPFGS